jgi:hypothetical protein
MGLGEGGEEKRMIESEYIKSNKMHRKLLHNKAIVERKV